MDYPKLTDDSFVWGNITLALKTHGAFSSAYKRMQEDRYHTYPTTMFNATSGTLTLIRGTISLFAKTVTGKEIAIFYDSHYRDMNYLEFFTEDIITINNISLEIIKAKITEESERLRMRAKALWEKNHHPPFEKPPAPHAGFFQKILAVIVKIDPIPKT